MLSNIQEKFSLEAQYSHIYHDITDRKTADFLPIDLNNLSTNVINFGVGYTFLSEKESRKRDAVLKSTVDTKYYTVVDADLITSYGMRLGIHQKSFNFIYYSEEDPFIVSMKSSWDTIIAPRHVTSGVFHQNNTMFYIGVSRKNR